SKRCSLQVTIYFPSKFDGFYHPKCCPTPQKGPSTKQLRKLYGRARITEGGAANLLQRLAHIYLGPDVEFPPASYRNNPGYITRIAPSRFAGVGPWNPSKA